METVMLPPNLSQSDSVLRSSNLDQSCPACGGLLVEIRTLCRCSRCAFSICVACEGERRELDERLEQR
jgi:hypothetical protein